MYSPRKSVQNYIWNVSDGVIPHLEFGYKLRAHYPKEEIKNGILSFLTFASILWVSAPNLETTHHPYIMGTLVLGSIFGSFSSALWSGLFIVDYLKGRLELKAFNEEFPKMMEERKSRKEVS